jgi:hypothetical protein
VRDVPSRIAPKPPAPQELRGGEAAVWGQPSAKRMIASNWRSCRQNTLRGFFDLAMPSGLKLIGCTLHESGDSRWVGMPARPQITTDGRVLTAPKTGKPSYSKVIDFDSRSTRDRFVARALAAIDRLLAGGRS